MRILVLDGNENQAVASVRALARAGHRVAVGAGRSWSKAGWSRACAEQFQYPEPDRDADSFVASIAAQAAREDGTLVLPMTERTTLPLSSSRDRIAAAGGGLVLPPHATLVRAFDKQQMTELAQTLGLDVPATTMIASDAEALDCSRTLRYPVVLKPRSSVEQVAGGVRPTGRPIYARTAGEFLRGWRDLSSRCRAALAQEFIDGVGMGYFALMRHGDLLAEFAHVRLRDVRPTGSGSSLRVSVAPDRRLRRAALAMLTALEWHGVAMVEFRVRSDGTPVFMEINGRFWNSLALAVYSGVDFPALIARLAETGDPPVSSSYRTGVRCRWLLGDIRHLVEVWRGAPAGYPGVFPNRLQTLADVLLPVLGTYHDNFTWRDPMPAVGDWLHFLLHTLPRTARPPQAAEVWHAAGRSAHP
jgi:predicted ATP-grasp superfamily ATP-dependent carboligase